jgi:hypothetical protein
MTDDEYEKYYGRKRPVRFTAGDGIKVLLSFASGLVVLHMLNMAMYLVSMPSTIGVFFGVLLWVICLMALYGLYGFVRSIFSKFSQ